MPTGSISEAQQYHDVPLALLGFTSWVQDGGCSSGHHIQNKAGRKEKA